MKNYSLNSKIFFVVISVVLLTSCNSAKRIADAKKEEDKMLTDAVTNFLAEQEAMRTKHNVKCSFTQANGKAVIKKIDNSNSGQVVVNYSFVYDDPSVVTKFPEANINRFFFTNSESSFKVGDEIKAIKHEIIPGENTKYCDQVKFEYPDCATCK